MKVNVRGAETHVSTGSRPLRAGGTEAVLFVHGAGMDHTVWVMQTRYFARHDYAVLAPDLPGHGRSAGEPLTTIEGMADWLADLLDVVGLARVSVVGHSMGSLAALALALRHGSRVQRLVLFGPSAPMPVSEALLAAAAADDHAAIDMANVWSHSNRGVLGGNPVPGMYVLRGGERLLERSAPGVFHADLVACNRFDAGTISPLAIPVTVVVGSEDRMTPPRAGRDLSARLGASVSVHTLSGSGHSMMSECPNEVLDVLIEAFGVED